MKNFYIKLCIGISIILMTIVFHNNKTHAFTRNDCGVTTGAISLFQDHKIKGKEIDLSKIMPEAALEKAIIHLTKYCCDQKLLSSGSIQCKNIDQLSLEKGPDSPYLFDHLIDIGIRRLDAVNTYELDADDTGVARHEALKKIMENEKGVIPTDIIKTYEKYRQLHTKFVFRKNHLKIENFDVDTVLGNFEEFIENYNDSKEVSLADKYNNICLIARNMYEKKPGEKILIGTDELSKGRSYYTDCQKLVTQRISKERTLIRRVIILQANKILIENLQQTINKHFVQDKLIKLQGKLITIRDLFTTIVKQAPVSKKCSN